MLDKANWVVCLVIWLIANIYLLIEPSGYPQNVEVTVNSPTSFKVSWTEVPEAERNGNITHYEIIYTPVNSPILEQQPKISITSSPLLDSILGGLEEFTMYSVSVRAVTIVGSGPPSPPQMNQTPEDGKQTLIITQCTCSQYHLKLVCWKRITWHSQHSMLA